MGAELLVRCYLHVLSSRLSASLAIPQSFPSHLLPWPSPAPLHLSWLWLWPIHPLPSSSSIRSVRPGTAARVHRSLPWRSCAGWKASNASASSCRTSDACRLPSHRHAHLSTTSYATRHTWKSNLYRRGTLRKDPSFLCARGSKRERTRLPLPQRKVHIRTGFLCGIGDAAVRMRGAIRRSDGTPLGLSEHIRVNRGSCRDKGGSEKAHTTMQLGKESFGSSEDCVLRWVSAKGSTKALELHRQDRTQVRCGPDAAVPGGR